MKKLLACCLAMILTLWVVISPALASDSTSFAKQALSGDFLVAQNTEIAQQFTCTKQGFYGDPYDCTKFHRCVDYEGNGEKFTKFDFDCGEGTIFDESLSVCNHPWAVSPPPPCMVFMKE